MKLRFQTKITRCLYEYALNTGLTEITRTTGSSGLNIYLDKVNPLIYASWMAQYGLKDELFSFVRDNFESIYNHELNLNDAWRENLKWSKVDYQQQRQQCIQELVIAKGGVDSSISALGWACFPALQYLRYFEDHTRFRDK